jgi:hypothetical protein
MGAIKVIITWLVTFVVLLLLASIFGLLGAGEVAIVLALSIAVSYVLLRVLPRRQGTS